MPVHVLFILNLVCVIQIMLGIQPDTFTNALIMKQKNSAIGRHFLEAHGRKNLLEENQFKVLTWSARANLIA